MTIPEVPTLLIRNYSASIGCHGRTASYLTAPAQIPACGITALGSSEILASIADPNPYKPSVILSFHPCRLTL
ncbi:hypothetical protein A2V47_05895 [Candidatus Atribacteria bacterium RBG_19FT_COMBO_35_14]|uniref:Uncharacterized protein n=1 Tax=Candidatus Sediminicultor quintus TaxID=1797291 RepID=A0A1F5AEW8_9BACT|nr:MAG: hypothetical protein A2V47_05895 [Candidatus Atribacteria bacterium RBG_19FT_COMBO_35_14]